MTLGIEIMTNTREKQFKRRKIYFDTWFQRFRTVLACSISMGLWWECVAEKVSHFMIARKQKQGTERSLEQDIVPKNRPLVTYFLQLGPISESFHHLLIMHQMINSLNV
jgi:hypothetical protein